MFELRNNKILWPRSIYTDLHSCVTTAGGIGLYEDDLLSLIEATGHLQISDDSVHYNEILAGTLGIDLEDVASAIKDKVENYAEWDNFDEYKTLRHSTKLTWEEFVEAFSIDIIEDNP